MIEIRITLKNRRYRAEVEPTPGVYHYGTGTSIWYAIGDLVAHHPELFGVSIIRDGEPGIDPRTHLKRDAKLEADRDPA